MTKRTSQSTLNLTSMLLMSLVVLPSSLLVMAFDLARPPSSNNNIRATSATTTALDMVNRKEVLTGLLHSVVGGVVVVATLFPTLPARADVSSGDMPNSAAQFNRIIRLKRDLKGVKKRVAENAADIDKVEWDNIGKFLRTVYKTGDEDMVAVAKSIKNTDNYARAMASIDKLKTFARAGDVSVNRQDGSGFVAVVEKMQGLVDDYFDALIDIPDEL